MRRRWVALAILVDYLKSEKVKDQGPGYPSLSRHALHTSITLTTRRIALYFVKLRFFLSIEIRCDCIYDRTCRSKWIFKYRILSFSSGYFKTVVRPRKIHTLALTLKRINEKGDSQSRIGKDCIFSFPTWLCKVIGTAISLARSKLKQGYVRTRVIRSLRWEDLRDFKTSKAPAVTEVL